MYDSMENADFEYIYDAYRERSIEIAGTILGNEDEAEDALEEYNEIEKIDDEEEKQARLEEFLEKLTRLGGSLFLCKKNRKKRRYRKIKFLGAGKATFKRKHFPHH